MKSINFSKIEKKWRKKWETARIFEAKEDSKKKKFYVLDMFPYPSGAGLHMGHAFVYSLGDIYARFKRMQGFNVLYPIGYDSLGLPAENAAIKAGEHPLDYTEKAMKNFMRQQKAMGWSYDWGRLVVTHTPEFYKWDQWIFLQMLKKGLAYRKKAPVNWCKKCETVLANEQVIDGKCWRHEDAEVEIKNLEQWFFKITDYADELVSGLEKLDWPENAKKRQLNWIGKSQGYEIEFEIEDRDISNVVIVHGSNDSAREANEGKPENVRHWQPWLRKELEKNKIIVSADLYPRDWLPDYESWRTVFEKNNIDENSILIGHSAGACFIIRWLSENKKKVKKIVLVAPSMFKSSKYKTNKLRFKDFEYGPELRNYFGELKIIYSSDDDQDILNSVNQIHERIGGQIIELKGKGHLTYEDMGTEEFPELLREVLYKKWPIFTTRPDTIYGVTFMVVAAQHPRLHELVTPEQKKDVNSFLKKIKSTSEKEMSELEKEGVFTGSYAINPANGEKVPVYAGNFVVADYGSGMVMAVPAHDQRDFEFAKKYGIVIKAVIGSDEQKNNAQDFLESEFKKFVEKAKKEKKEFILSGGFAIRVFCGVRYRNHKDIDILIPEKDFAFWKDYFTKNGYGDYKEMGDKRDYAKYALYSKEINGENVEFDVWVIGNDEKGYFDREWGNRRYWNINDDDIVYMDYEGTKIKLSKKLTYFMNQEEKRNEKKLALDSCFALEKSYSGSGALINSAEFNGLKSEEAKEKIGLKFGKKVVNYKLRDWLISRQRYWGTPIPIVYCDKCGIVPVPEKDLPVKLPKKVKFGEGNPLATNKEFVKAKCPRCGKNARRETDTMDTFVNSSWYFLRYTDPRNEKKIFDEKKVSYWTPIDQYIGGPEHITMHLIYMRFYTKFLRDIGLLKFDEPTKRYFTQGIVHGVDGEKMSKSKGNVIEPLEMIKKFGADTLRLALVSFAGPDKDSKWDEKIVVGSHKFINKVYEYFDNWKAGKSDEKIESRLHKTIKEASDDVENFKHNLAVIKIRNLFDYFSEKKIDRNTAESFLKMLHVYCPFITEEIWSKLGHKSFISIEQWPEFDAKKINEKFEMAELAVETTVSDIMNILKIMKEKKNIEGGSVFVYVLPRELEFYDAETLTRRVGKEVKVFAVNDSKKYDPEGKSSKAKPGKPAIYVE